jgi:glycosyltransferase involved in cell wall biosynthesis
MNILALEPWYEGSHQRFLDGLVEHSGHDIRTITMPGRFWRWRMEGGGVTLAKKVRTLVDEGFQPDLVFATDKVNLPAVLSLARPQLQGVPVVLYFHENQLTYPLPPDEERERAYAITNYLSALAADRVVFNSQFHFEEFIEALPQLLRDFPDFTNMHTVRDLREKSMVLHQGIDLAAHDEYRGARTERTLHATTPPVVLWNQRWEYDKNPSGFFRTMNRLDDTGVPFQLILAGKHFHEQPDEFEQAFERYAERILHYGYAEDFAEYSRLLHRADVVVSTARHEFFGVAIQEAIYCGCHPLLPNRLSYPELIPETHHEPLLHAPILYEDDDELFERLRDVLEGEERPLPPDTLRKIPAGLDWDEHVDHYDALFEDVAHNVLAATAGAEA